MPQLMSGVCTYNTTRVAPELECQGFAGITTAITQVSAACAFLTRDQQLNSSERLSAQTRHRIHRFRATQQLFSAQPGVVRGFR